LKINWLSQKIGPDKNSRFHPLFSSKLTGVSSHVEPKFVFATRKGVGITISPMAFGSYWLATLVVQVQYMLNVAEWKTSLTPSGIVTLAEEL
jgi:hypothetical protein